MSGLKGEAEHMRTPREFMLPSADLAATRRSSREREPTMTRRLLRHSLVSGFAALAIAGQKGYHGVAIASRLPIRRSWTKAVMGLDD